MPGAAVRSYGGRAANIASEDGCGLFHTACNTLHCCGCWILLALCGTGLITWGIIQHTSSSDSSASIAAISCGVVIVVVAVIVMARACSKFFVILIREGYIVLREFDPVMPQSISVCLANSSAAMTTRARIGYNTTLFRNAPAPSYQGLHYSRLVPDSVQRCQVDVCF